MSACRRMQIDLYLSNSTKLKSKWIKVFNITLHTLDIIEDKVGNSLESIDAGNKFPDRTPIAQSLRSTINK